MISLTDHIEIIKIEDLFKAGTNLFEMIPKTTSRIKDIVGRFKIFESTHAAYLVQIKQFELSLTQIAYTDAFNPLSSYMFVNRKIILQDEKRMENRLFEIYRMRAKPIVRGDVGRNKQIARFPIQMPSRGKTFR